MCQNEHGSGACCQGRGGHDLNPSSCHCGGGFQRRFILPAIMLLLAYEPSHGYSLLGKLSELGILGEDDNPTMVYRVLNRLEAEGLACHDHQDGARGPARKVYYLTDEGLQALKHWSDQLDKMGNLFAWFSKTYGSIDKE